MSAHTAGPWIVHPVDSKMPQLGIYRLGDAKSTGRIAAIPMRDGRHAMATADALLIAAAPELLQIVRSLVACVDAVGSGEISGAYLDRSAPLIVNARGVIAKALGNDAP